ncbi:MAG: FHA domain-containing protein [Candidatus Bathyarchaeia archaeon]
MSSIEPEKTVSMIVGVILVAFGFLLVFIDLIVLGILLIIGGGLLISTAMKRPTIQPSPPPYIPSSETKVLPGPREGTITLVYPGGTRTLIALLQANGRNIPITNLPQTFGRSNFVGILDPSSLDYISGEHFTINYDFTSNNFLIWDNNSKNGTYLNGVDIRGKGPQILKNGDVISVAKILNIRFISY